MMIFEDSLVQKKSFMYNEVTRIKISTKDP
jgi:hypothetical protein